MTDVFAALAALALVGVLWWAGLWVLAAFVGLVCGLAALTYLGHRHRERERGERDEEGRALRDLPPPSG